MGSAAARSTGPDGAINGPRRPIREVHPWSACDPETCWDVAALALRSTRDEALQKALTQRRREKLVKRRKDWERDRAARLTVGRNPKKKPLSARANLTAGESAAVKSRVRPYTLLDYLYRLRIKTNYEDATVFVLSRGQKASKTWRKSLSSSSSSQRQLCWRTSCAWVALSAVRISCDSWTGGLARARRAEVRLPWLPDASCSRRTSRVAVLMTTELVAVAAIRGPETQACKARLVRIPSKVTSS